MRRDHKRLFALAMTSLALGCIAYGQSIPSYTPPVIWAAPGASATASGDMNGDGRIDVVTANGVTTGSHGVSVLLSNGDGTFQTAANFVTNTDPTSIVIGDFNGDGKLDVAAANKTANSISILLGNGDGTLQQATTIVLSSSPWILIAADVNTDGKTDLVVAQVNIAPLTGAGTYLGNALLSNGDGTFSPSIFPLASANLVVADFNGDGKPDLFLYQAAVAAIRFGNGDGTFTASPLAFSTNGLAFRATHIVAGDFNGDGKMDLYGEYITAQVTRSVPGFSESMALGNGDGTFTVVPFANNTGVDGQNLITGDFNGDGRLDVAGVFPGALHFFGSVPPYVVKVLYGNGDGTLAPPVSFAAGSSASVFTGPLLVSADFDGNGAPDFALATTFGVSVIRNASGNPPLISRLSVNSNGVVGGATTVIGTVTLGAPAPAGGSVITLTSSNPAAASFPGGAAITIPAGGTSAAFNIATSVVAVAGLVTITASANLVNQTTSFNVVPAYTLSSITFAPASGYGWFGGGSGTVGTVTLTSQAIDGVVVSLTSSNPALLSVPASLAIAPGATSATFAAFALDKVAADTPVVISGSLDGITRNGVYTVLTGIDTVRITKAEYIVKNAVLQIEATDSNPSASIRVLTATGRLLTILQPAGGGTYKGAASVPGPFTTVVLQSTLGGFTTGPVAQK